MELLGPTEKNLSQALDVIAVRQRLIAANIANVNVAGYKAKDLRFDEVLGKYTESEREGINPRQDGNTVVMEIETAAGRKNTLAYQLYLQALNHEVRLTKSAIDGRAGA